MFIGGKRKLGGIRPQPRTKKPDIKPVGQKTQNNNQKNCKQAERSYNKEKKSIRYKRIMWKQLGQYTHYGFMGDELHFLRIQSKPRDIFRITVDLFAPIFDHNIEKKTFKDLEEAKQYCQDVLVPRMASIFVEGADG